MESVLRHSSEQTLAFSLDPCVKYIIEGSKRLQCSVATRTKALLIYHHFKKLQNLDSDYMIAAACLNLSIKFYADDIKTDALIFAFSSIAGRSMTSAKVKGELNMMQQSLQNMELIILRNTEFNINHHLALEFLVFYLNDIREVMITHNLWDVLCEFCMKLACDFYLSIKCLDYKPDEIALAVLKAALYFVGYTVDSDPFFTPWLKALNTVPESKLCDIVQDIIIVCQHVASNSL